MVSCTHNDILRQWLESIVQARLKMGNNLFLYYRKTDIIRNRKICLVLVQVASAIIATSCFISDLDSYKQYQSVYIPIFHFLKYFTAILRAYALMI